MPCLILMTMASSYLLLVGIQKGGRRLIRLSNFASPPNWRTNYITRISLNHEYAKVYPTSDIWRVRSKKMGTIALARLQYNKSN